MKKLISIIAAAALVFTMALPVMAATSPSVESPSADSSANSSASGSTASGSNVNITETAANLSTAEEASVHNAAAAIAGDNAYVLYFTNIEAPAGYFRNNRTLRVEFSRDYAPDLLGILYWNSSTQSWDVADFAVNGNIISAVFLHTCNVAFVVKAPAVTQTQADSTDAVSPQTGMSYTTWAVLALTTAAGSCLCITVARKLKKQQEV